MASETKSIEIHCGDNQNTVGLIELLHNMQENS